MLDFNSLVPVIGSIAGGAVGAGALSGPLKSLDDWWYYHFGKNTELKHSKAQLLNESKLEAYKKDIYDEVKKIPAGNIKQPQLNIIGPALEASKYYIDEPQLRKMFSKIVASSIDSSKESITRSVFVEFLKQMSSLDAIILSSVAKNGVQKSLPIVNIRRRLLDNAGSTIIKYQVLPVTVISNSNQRSLSSSSLTNLVRMGLITITNMSWISNYDYKENFSKTPEYKAIIRNQEEAKKQYQELAKAGKIMNFDIHNDKLDELRQIAYSSIEFENGLLNLTPLGKDFVKICI